ncbi:MAG: element excision factor XisI family protein [Cyanobacteria bacterium J06581_3]
MKKAYEPQPLIGHRFIVSQYIKALLSKRAAVESGSSEIESQLICDDTNDHYQIMRTGWKGNSDRIHYCSVHVDIKDGKIWV